ncbi:thermonuclease family protein [Candidatus Poribacteria bacterium]
MKALKVFLPLMLCLVASFLMSCAEDNYLPTETTTELPADITILEPSTIGTTKERETLPKQSPPAISIELADVVWHTVNRVIDGDTIELQTGERVRYIGMDTPETVYPLRPVEPCGPEASQFNKELVQGKKVRLEFDVQRLDNRDRTLAYVYLQDGTFVNAELVRQGYAVVSTYPPNIKYVELFLELEWEAKQAKRGCIWANAPDDQTGVIIDWVLADAPDREPDGEIIRLRNNSDQVVDISDWRLTDEEGDYYIPEGTEILPHDTWEVHGYEYNPTRNRRGLFLNNSDDSVALFDASDNRVDFEDW